MTTLPRLTPAETSITSILYPTISKEDPQRKSYSSIGYRELANTWGGSATHHPDVKPSPHTATGGRSFPRLDPLHPPKYGRTVSLETTIPHYQNELRSLNMKREQYHKFHRAWMKPVYGSKLEQEEYRWGLGVDTCTLGCFTLLWSTLVWSCAEVLLKRSNFQTCLYMNVNNLSETPLCVNIVIDSKRED